MMTSALDRFFGLTKSNTSVRRGNGGGPHDLSCDELSRLRRAVHACRRRHEPRGGDGGDDSCDGRFEHAHGPVGQHPDCAWPGPRHQRLLCLLRLRAGGLYLAGGPCRGLHFGRGVLSSDGDAHSRAHHQFDSARPQDRHVGRHRLLHCAHRHEKLRGSL